MPKEAGGGGREDSGRDDHNRRTEERGWRGGAGGRPNKTRWRPQSSNEREAWREESVRQATPSRAPAEAPNTSQRPQGGGGGEGEFRGAQFGKHQANPAQERSGPELQHLSSSGM